MIGKNIKSLRKTHDLTQDDFARIVGISRNSLSRYENGTSSVSTELIDIIFTPDQESEQVKTESIYREETLDDTLKEAKNQLHKEQLEKNLERFRKNNT